MTEAVAIGIDLGTTYSCVAFVDGNGGVTVIKNNHGRPITPSVVSFENKRILIGKDAIRKRGTDPANTVFQVKRLMGKRADDKYVAQKNWPFEIISDKDGLAAIRVYPEGQEQTLCPEQISSYILAHLKEMAELYLQSEVRDAVITVPANFNDAQRKATKLACEIAGLNVLRIVNEPTAAALAYGWRQTDRQARKILVYDLGGGTFDASIVRMVGKEATVIASKGITLLGGEDFTQRLFEEVVCRMEDDIPDLQSGKDLALNWKLLQECENAKKVLSTEKDARIAFEASNRQSSEVCITRKLYEELTEDLVERTISCVESVIQSSGEFVCDLDDIVLVGGASRMPLIRDRVREMFATQTIKCDIDPDEAVAYGAAILANSLLSPLKPSSVSLTEITSLSLGTDKRDDEFSVVIPARTKIPCSQTKFHRNIYANTDRMTFDIYEGESRLVSGNHLLDSFTVPLPPRPAGENKVKVTFSIDQNGILSVTAEEQETGETRGCVIQAKSRFTPKDAIRMKLEAHKRRSQDQQERQRERAKSEIVDSISRVKRAARQSIDERQKKVLEGVARRESLWLNANANADVSALKLRIVHLDASRENILNGRIEQ